MHDHAGRRTPAPPPRRWPWLAGLVGALTLSLGVVACGGGAKAGGVASRGPAGQQPTPVAAPAATKPNRRRCSTSPGACASTASTCLTRRSSGPISSSGSRAAEQNGPRFKAAQPACRQDLPNGGQPSPPSAEERQRALAFARCMRQHGINLPDPRITKDGIDQPPAPGVHRDDPRLTAAQQACSQRGGGGK